MSRSRKHQKDPDLALATKEVKDVYAALANRPRDSSCTLRTECCHFKLTGKTPFLTQGEALVAARALRQAGRKELPERTDGACRLLNPRTSRCIIYEGRPFGCRSHFCQAAGGPFPRSEVADLIRRLEVVDEQLYGTGPRELHAAVADALKTL